MLGIRSIRTEEDYEAALARVSHLMDVLSGPEEQIEDLEDPNRIELDVLVDLVEFYEAKQHPIEFPSAVAAIEFHMDQQGLTQRDLIPYIGSRAKVSEILSGKRPITMSMARALHRHLGIPSDILLQDPGADFDSTFEDIDPRRFPLTIMAKRGWISDDPDLKDRAEELIRELIGRAGCRELTAVPVYRKNDHRRINAKTDPYALKAWCWHLMAEARAAPPLNDYQPGTVTPDFLRQVARLSRGEDGPLKAQEFLSKRGIALQVLRHLPRTHLDGAALLLGDGRPVIGLTLRYDRIDNFWFTLLHELAHVGRHLHEDSDDWFADDFTLRNRPGTQEDIRETEADEWAENALIPPEAWSASPVRQKPTAMAVINFSSALGIHPAIVAGRVRYERGNYHLLSQFVGTGQVRRQFEAGLERALQ